MKFMMLVCVDPARFADDEAADAAENGDADNTGSFPWLDDVIARGIRLHGDRLRPAGEAKTVQVRDGKTHVTNGTYLAEGAGGYSVYEAESMDAAIAMAARIPAARLGGAVEIRPAEKYF